MIPPACAYRDLNVVEVQRWLLHGSRRPHVVCSLELLLVIHLEQLIFYRTRNTLGALAAARSRLASGGSSVDVEELLEAAPLLPSSISP